LQRLGYEVERGAHGQPEIKGYTKEYLEASSPRRQQIEQRLAEQGRRARSGADRRAPTRDPGSGALEMALRDRDIVPGG